ncbi:MAG TPA: CueP family metal-binding protein [Jiangellales bacterium]|nr:CueP family metal-binding protein [Jiangellales bacterium]
MRQSAAGAFAASDAAGLVGFFHSLTTCQGELVSTEMQVQIVDEGTAEVLVDETRTTFENGFTGFWLPTDIEGTLRVSHDGRTGVIQFSTHPDAPTCLTTIQLV